MFEYVLNRIHYDHRKKKWIDDGIVGIYDTLNDALVAQGNLYDDKNHPGTFQYYIEHRIKLVYAGSN